MARKSRVAVGTMQATLLFVVLALSAASALRVSHGVSLRVSHGVSLTRRRCSLHRSCAVVACDAADEGGWEEYEWWEDGVSVCEYTEADTGKIRLGVYTAYSIVESDPHIRPLCVASADDGISCLFCDEDVPSVPLSAVRDLLDPDYVFVSERQAGGGQGLGNPHGEHGETVYDLRDCEISDDVVLVLNEGRDTERVL